MGLTREAGTQTEEGLTSVRVNVVRLTKYAVPPSWVEEGSVVPIFCSRTIEVPRMTPVSLATDVTIELPPGVQADVMPAKNAREVIQHGILVTTIPPLSRAEVQVAYMNYTSAAVTVQRGERIATIAIYAPFIPLLKVYNRDGSPYLGPMS